MHAEGSQTRHWSRFVLIAATLALRIPGLAADDLPTAYAAAEKMIVVEDWAPSAIRGKPVADKGAETESGDFLEKLIALALEKIRLYQDREVASLSPEEWDQRGEGLWLVLNQLTSASHLVEPGRYKEGRRQFCRRAAVLFTAQHFVVFASFQNKMARLQPNKNESGLKLMSEIRAAMSAEKRKKISELTAGSAN